MKVRESELVALLADLGAQQAEEWKGAELADRVNRPGGVARFEDPPGSYRGKHKAIFDRIAAAQAAGEAVEVAGEEFVTKSQAAPAKKPAAKKKATNKAAKKAAPKAKAAAVPASNGHANGHAAVAKKPAAKKAPAGRIPQSKVSYAEWAAQFQKKPMAITPRGPGVMRAVVEELKAAGKAKKVLTKAELLDILKARFPDRDQLKMLTNLNNLIPGRLKRFYGIHVWKGKTDKGETGYFIQGDGRAAQKVPAQK